MSHPVPQDVNYQEDCDLHESEAASHTAPHGDISQANESAPDLPTSSVGTPDAWEAILAEIMATGGTTLLLGGMDTGKSTLARWLTRRLAEAGRRPALLDADLGQSEVGPPTCAGLARLDTPQAFLAPLAPDALIFVGSTSPQGLILEHASAVRRLADLAGERPLIVDTTGWIQGQGARRLKQAKFDLLRPTHVIALQRAGELDSLLAPMRRRDFCCVYTPPVSDQVVARSSRYRAQRRRMRWAAYFADAPTHTLALDDVTLCGTWLGSGLPLAPHLLKFCQQTVGPGIRVYYGELAHGHLGLMVSQPLSPDTPALSLIQQQFKTSSLTLTPAPRLKHLLVGLEGGSGKLLGLGSLVAIDFRRRTLGILTPVRIPQAAQIVRFGNLRVQPDGTEAGSIST